MYPSRPASGALEPTHLPCPRATSPATSVLPASSAALPPSRRGDHLKVGWALQDCGTCLCVPESSCQFCPGVAPATHDIRPSAVLGCPFGAPALELRACGTGFHIVYTSASHPCTMTFRCKLAMFDFHVSMPDAVGPPPRFQGLRHLLVRTGVTWCLKGGRWPL